MGSGIAQLSASSGFETILFDTDDSTLRKSEALIKKNLQILVEKNKITSEQESAIYKKIVFTNNREGWSGDVVIEAITERAEAKISLFNQLAEDGHDQTIFATNTSSLSITQIASGFKYPERLIGMHFFNPAPIMKLVEVVRTRFTSQGTLHSTIELAKQFGKTPVLCMDSPGFIVNRVARPFYIESLRAAEEGNAFFTIDSLLEATGFKMGPFRLMDLIGNDINFAVSTSVYDQLGKPERLKPSFIQKEKVDGGDLGKKSGRGYYSYP